MTKRQDLDQDRHGPADRAPTTMKRMPQRRTNRRSNNRATHIAALWVSCENMEAAYRDCVDWRVDWALRQIRQLMRITMEMAPDSGTW
eukprot:7429449-Pyramimonas_sp.AAC.1